MSECKACRVDKRGHWIFCETCQAEFDRHHAQALADHRRKLYTADRKAVTPKEDAWLYENATD